MPIYTYKCKKCGTVFDFLMLTKNDTPECQKCGSTDVDKQYSVFGVKGSSGKTSSQCIPQST